MAHSLGLKVVAEGVEQQRQLDFLVESGCDEVQGYLLSQAIGADAVLEVRASRNGVHFGQHGGNPGGFAVH
jgi:EAL domain-containing protein (putative c-di-GMP-specific phosphodiesterase class I)